VRSAFRFGLRAGVFVMTGMALWSSASAAAPPHATHIYGIHSWGFGAGGLLRGKSGWTVEVVNTDTFPYDPTPSDIQNMVNDGWTPIIRINKYFGETVLASASEYDAFAQACADKVSQYGAHCNIWILGNEMNAAFEGGIPVASYADVYTRCRSRIREVQPEATVLVAAVAPWNPSQSGSGPYPSNQQWLNYMYDLVHRLGDNCDGYAIHAYGGRGGDSDPRDDDDWGFGVFKRWMEIIDGHPDAARKPVYLTEMNHAADGDKPDKPGFPLYDYPAGYIRLLFEAIDDWNATHAHRILSACWFSYANGGFPGYNISTNSTMADDFSWTTENTEYLNGNPAGLPAPIWSSLE